MTRRRLASYDRAIRAEPSFSSQQAPGLREDLTEYLATLQVYAPILSLVILPEIAVALAHPAAGAGAAA